MSLKIDATLLGSDISQVKARSIRAEAQGYDGVWVGETDHDPFLMSLLAAEATTRPTVGTEIAIAFARTPMTLAYTGHDLACYSQGRFVLGLGSQIKAHVVRRFNMPWSEPAKRMREFILATRAIWQAWNNEETLNFRGDFYQHTLMTPFFSPPRHEFGPPPIYAGGVGAVMTEAVGEVADGYFFHPFTTEAFFNGVTLPALTRGRATAGGDLSSLVISGPAFVAAGRTEEELARAIAGTKKQIAFYASTPSYKAVLELSGYGELQVELNRFAKAGDWDAMGDAIDDDLLRAISAVGTPAECGAQLKKRWGAVAERISLYFNYETDEYLGLEVADAARG
jgi:probable F420-dependent oxidoreductase